MTVVRSTGCSPIIGEALGIDFNIERVIEAQKMTARGSYFRQTGNRLPADAAVYVEHAPWNLAPGLAQRLSDKAPFAIQEKGNSVAAWSFHSVTDHGPDSSVIHIIYNNWVYFIAVTGEAAENAARNKLEYMATQPNLERRILEYPTKVVVPKDRQGNPIIPPS